VARSHHGAQAGATLLALGAAFLYAVTSVLQQSAAADVAHERSLRLSLLLSLVRSPRWLLGNLAEVGAVALQFLALRRGSLLLVQALLVSGLLVALPLGAALQHRRLATNDWLGAMAVVAGLGVFVSVARPTTGRGDASALGWALVLLLGGGAAIGLVLRAPRHPGSARATYLGAACGVLFGIDAALAKATGHVLDHGVVHALQTWEPYALAILGALGFLLAQSAFQAGPLGASLPVLTATDPVVAALIGVLAFHERVAGGAGAVVVQLAAAALIVTGVWVLARSPLVAPPPLPSTP
jgi:drug/metabolite transporter (DMT)-like permease